MKITLGTHVEIELIEKSGESEHLAFDIVVDKDADFYSGLLGISTPLAKAIQGHRSGEAVPYPPGSGGRVRILNVSHTHRPVTDAAEKRRAIVKEAVIQSEITNQMIFATSTGSKWGDYDVDMEKLLKKEKLMITIAIFGAAGKMGTRISRRLQEAGSIEYLGPYKSLYVEAGEIGQARLRESGLEPTAPDIAAAQADVVILAIPDKLLGKVSRDIVPQMKSGAMVICLDPAAPWGGELAQRRDVSYFVCHPCHPPVVNDEIDPEARMDFFGAIKAKQHVVAALMQGPESDYARGEAIVRAIFAPVMNVYRVTVEQMAILEPALSETVVLTCMVIITEAIEEAVKHGVPAEAARQFVLGHMNVNIGILFKYIDAQLSDGAKMAVARGRERIFQPDWKDVFKRENVMAEVKAITQGITLK
jgi:pyrroline-5-carboxylate reductase